MKKRPLNHPQLPFGESFESIEPTPDTGQETLFDSFFAPKPPEDIDHSLQTFLNGMIPRYEDIHELRYATHHTRMSGNDFSILRNSQRKQRKLEVPNLEMRKFQRWLNDEILPYYQTVISDIACGIAGRQLADMVAPHIGNRYFFKFDLKDAYSSVDLIQLATIISHADARFTEEWHSLLQRFCSAGQGLATGAITSPVLFNIYMAPLDDFFVTMRTQHDMTVTRYMDDIVFSAKEPIGKRKATRIKQAVYDYGLRINDKKVKYHDLQADGPFMVTGVQLNPNGHWQLPRRYARNMLAHVRDAQRFLDETGTLDIEAMGEIRGLHGHLLACTKQTRPRTDQERALFEAYHRLEATYRALNPSWT